MLLEQAFRLRGMAETALSQPSKKYQSGNN